MDSQSNRTINLFNKFNLVIPETLTYHIDGFPERRSAFIIDNDDSFVITFEEGMKCLDMSNDKSLVCFNHRIDERYVHQQRFGKNKVEIHLRALYSVLDTDYLGLDVKRWAKEGLVDRIISYPNRHYEKYDGDIWQENKEYRIDLEKYTDYVVTRGRSTNVHIGDLSEFEPPYTNYRGELCGPASEKERIQEWMQLEKEYGVKIYFEIMGRHYPNEVFKKRTLELYENGAERIGMWDTYARAVRSAMWTTAGKLGHKEELADMDPESGYRIWRVRRLAGYDVSRYDPFWGG